MRAVLRLLAVPAVFAAALLAGNGLRAAEEETAVARDYSRVVAPPAPAGQTLDQVSAKSDGCYSCHVRTDAPTMHETPAVRLGCTDCHGGDATVRGNSELPHDHPDYIAARELAHVLPRYPESWHYPSSANPQQSYALLNREAPEFVRFVNPSDYRVAREACGACHIETIEAAERSLMATGSMFWGGAAYNNGILPYKNYAVGEAYTRDGEPAKIVSAGDPPGTVTAAQQARGALAELYPLPTWQVVPPADVFRVFERGGRNIATQFPEIGLPNPTGSIQRLEEPGRPDLRQSNRGPATGLRVAIPVLNIHKTRLNDPFMWFMGTNDQPGDYRHSGCASCHVIYANDREPRHSLIYAQYGRDGQSVTVDPTIAGLTQPGRSDGHGAVRQPGDHRNEAPVKQSGHPLRHVFTRAIPTAQCMNCNMHQPNIFLNSYLGYTMWDYESDADLMWPGPENRLQARNPAEERQFRNQRYPTESEQFEILDRNPEAAAVRGLWGDPNFLREVYDRVNPMARNTQFADYHGHGWNFRAIFRRDREGILVDADGAIIPDNDPDTFRREGEGLFVPVGTNLELIRNEDGRRRFEWMDCELAREEVPNLRCASPNRRVLVQRSIVDPSLSWAVQQVADSVDATLPVCGEPGERQPGPCFNQRSARSKLVSRTGAETGRYTFGTGIPDGELAHPTEEMACFTCHLSWTTSCGGCHLPIEANVRTSVHRYEGEETRNFATYNPQVAREAMFQLGRHQTSKGNIIAPVRSTSALVLSSTNINRERIYIQQPPVAASGFSSQAFAPHYPHTDRTTETKQCTDCHVSQTNDNNAIMAQLLLHGTNFVNFVGLHSWIGLEGGFEAVRVTEWDEPQAVIGSYLHRFAYPDYFRMHRDRNNRELINWTRGQTFDRNLSGETRALEQFYNIVQGTPDRVGCLQNRGEYMFVAQGSGGFRVYDIASIANKGFSERIITAPVSPLGQDTHVETRNATCMALPTNQPIAPNRNEAMASTPRPQPDGSTISLLEENQEQSFHPIYHYAVITDAEEGLVLVNVDTLADGEARNNHLRRTRFANGANAWNENGVLNGARHITLAGHYAYIITGAGLVVLDLNNPQAPRVAATVPLNDARASALQFRYLWVTDAEGLKLFDVTRMDQPVPVPGATVPFVDARRVYLARTYAYVAAGSEGLVIVNVTRPEHPQVFWRIPDPTFWLGHTPDTQDVTVASTNASLFAYVADGRNGMKVLQLFSPESNPNFYGFSPRPAPQLIAWARTPNRALSVAKGLDRDRAVDETGGQIAVFGRLGSRPFNRSEMERLYLNRQGRPYSVTDTGSMADWVGPGASVASR